MPIAYLITRCRKPHFIATIMTEMSVSSHVERGKSLKKSTFPVAAKNGGLQMYRILDTNLSFE
jgi:hypothetical protein